MQTSSPSYLTNHLSNTRPDIRTHLDTWLVYIEKVPEYRELTHVEDIGLKKEKRWKGEKKERETRDYEEHKTRVMSQEVLGYFLWQADMAASH